MSNNQDARPFVDLKKDAEEFRTKFDEDIAECMNFLDAKITALICDPDSLGSICLRPNSAAEFSRAKYDIFISVKKLVMQKEREWTDYISEMKKLFLENVEIFLAGTKLEVKLPSAEFQSSLGPRKSPGNRKSTSVASSLINTFTRNIPGLSTSRQSQEVSSKFLDGTSNVEDKAQSSKMGRYTSKLPPFTISNPSYHKDSSSADSEDEAVGEKGAAKMAVDVDSTRRGKSVVAKAPARSRRAAKAVIEEEISEEDIIPDPVPAKPTSRRKTFLPPNLINPIESDIVPGISMTKSKRKTISAVSELEAGAPPKRLKLSSRKGVSSEEKDDADDDNLLESDEYYSDWMPLKSIDGKIPTRPAIYELKVWRAKKPAYIGECESLRQKLTLYKLRQNSGHKHLDKFVDRNYNDIQVRFEVVESLSNAKEEVKNRIKAFVAQHKTTPAYN